MDSLSTELIDYAFTMGFYYGKTWFMVYLVVVLGLFIYHLTKRL